MASINGIPVYKVNVDESNLEKGLDFISLVDTPAIQTNWVAMSKEAKIFLSEDKQILYGPILIPDQYIYRYDEKMGDYYIVFSAQEIQKLVRKFQAEQKSINLNYQHTENSQINQAVIQEIWLTGNPDKSQSMGFELPEGTAFIGAYIGDKEFWLSEVKTGKVKGFSIEGFLDIQLKKQNMVKLIEANAANGILIKQDAETWTAGQEVYSEVEEAKVKVEDGDYDLGNGIVLKIKDGKIEEVTEVTPDEAAELRKILEPVIGEYETKLKALEEKMIALETKLENQPAKKEEKKEVKTEQTAFDRVTKLRELINKKTTKQ